MMNKDGFKPVRFRWSFRETLISVSWIWFVVLALTPVGLVLLVSFCTRDYHNVFVPLFTLEHYRQLLQPAYLIIFMRSLGLAASCTLLALLLGYPFAYFIAKAKAHWQPILFLLVVIPFWTSSLVRVYAIMLIIKQHGLINRFLLWLGVIQQPLRILYSNCAVLIGATYDLLPLMIMPIYLSISKIDPYCIEAARDLGASSRFIFWKILMPLSKRGIINGCLMVFLPSITLFYIPALLGGSRSLLLGNLIENQFLVFNNWPMGSAISSLLIVVVMVVVLFRWAVNERRTVSRVRRRA